MKHPLFVSSLIVLCGLTFLLIGCGPNTIKIDTARKMVTTVHGGGFTYLTIDGEGIFIQYMLRDSCMNKDVPIYLLRPNPCYSINIVSEKQTPNSNDNFVFKPVPGIKYRVSNNSNGDAGAASCEIVFDSLDNIRVLEADSAR